MLARRLAPALAAVAVAGLAAAGCSDQSAALRVGDRTFSDADVQEELDVYVDNEVLAPEGGPAVVDMEGELHDSYDQEFVAQILQNRVLYTVVAQVFAAQGMELTDADRSSARDDLANQFGPTFDAFPEDYQRRFIDDVARYDVLQAQLGEDEARSALTDALESTDIEVSSRYGSWDEERATVVPPPGPAPAPDEHADPSADDETAG